LPLKTKSLDNIIKKRIIIRKLTRAEKLFVQELELYDTVVDVTALISMNQHNLEADGRGIRASGIYTKQTLTALSLKQISNSL
jgi:hypothetical protein